jgi:hypothetical protein
MKHVELAPAPWWSWFVLIGVLVIVGWTAVVHGQQSQRARLVSEGKRV